MLGPAGITALFVPLGIFFRYYSSDLILIRKPIGAISKWYGKSKEGSMFRATTVRSGIAAKNNIYLKEHIYELH